MRTVDTYDRFHRHIRAWVAREIDCLAVLSRPGVGKSWAVGQMLGNRPHHRFGARQSPIEVYNRRHDRPDLFPRRPRHAFCGIGCRFEWSSHSTPPKSPNGCFTMGC